MGPIYYHGRNILLLVGRIARNSAEMYSTLCDPLWPAAVQELQSKGWEGNDRNSVLPKLQRIKIMLLNMRGNDRNSMTNRKLYFSVYPARARSARACALRALGLLLADGASTVGRGKTFCGATKFFYGNCCNSGTESRKIVLNVGN